MSSHMCLLLVLLLPCSGLAEFFKNKPVWGDDSAKVVFMNDDHFDTYRKNTDKFLAFFYAPWCGHCKNAKPHFAKASEGANLPMLAVDCTSSGKKTCEKFQVSGYPTFKFFSGGLDNEPKDYDGGRTSRDFLTYVNQAHDPTWVYKSDTPFENKPEWGDESGKVVFQNDDHFSDYLAKTPQFLAFFYAPWCGHCKSAKPHYGKASVKSAIPMVALDCTASASGTCSKNGVNGYPTIKFFQDGQASDYTGGRTESGFLRFLEKQHPDYVPEPYSNNIPEEWQVNMTNGNVYHVGDEYTEEFLKKHERVIGFFYAPWCGYCKAAKPDYARASTRYRRGIAFAAFDCTGEAGATCRKYNVTQYPIVKFLTPTTNETRVPADGTQWGSGDFVALADQKLAQAAKGADGKLNFKRMRVKHMRKWLKARGLQCKGCAEKRDFIALIKANLDTPLVANKAPDSKSKKGGMTLMEERRHKKALAREVDGWTDESFGNGNVRHFATAVTFDKFLADENKDGSLVMFYAPWCGHCKTLKPKYVQASTKIQKEGNKGVLAAVDADFAVELKDRFKIKSFPTMKYFAAGQTTGEPAEGLMDAKELIKFMMKKADPNWVPPPPEPFVNKAQWGVQSGDVVFMDDDHFEAYRDETEQFLAFFYAPWCGHCKAAKPHYGKASTKVSTPMLAVDCTGEGQKTCQKYDVKSYPTIKYFADDDFEDYQGGRQEKDFVQFLSKVTDDAEVVDDADTAGADTASAGDSAGDAAGDSGDAGADGGASAGDSASADDGASAGGDAGASADADTAEGKDKPKAGKEGEDQEVDMKKDEL